MKMSKFNEIVGIIKQNKNFILAGHVNPDGDCIGATIALALALKKMGKEAIIYLESFLPLFHYLEGSQLVCTDIKNMIPLSDQVVLMLDSSDEGRLGEGKIFLEEDNVSINIDHHASNNSYGDFNYIEADASSTCEIVYALINELEVELDKSIATALYTGIIYDTGVFRHPNTKSSTHQVVSNLLTYEIDASDIVNQLFYTKTYVQTKLLGLALSKMELHFGGRVALSTISLDELKHNGGQVSDVDGIVQYISQVDTAECAIFIYEKEKDILKVSLRSKKTLNVAELANTFGGGGHIRAAGCTIESTIDEAKERLLHRLIDFRSDL